MAKFLKAVLSEPSRGSISRGVATVTIGEVAEPPPPAVIDNEEFYATWHCVWVSPNSKSYTAISTVSIANFKKGYEYLIAASQYHKVAEMGWHSFLVPDEISDLGRSIAVSGGVDGDISLNTNSGVIKVESGSVNLVKIMCRPIRTIGSEAERKYPTDWLRRSISVARTSNFNFEHNMEYRGFTTNRASSSYFYEYSCYVFAGMVHSRSYVSHNVGVCSYRNGVWVSFLAANQFVTPAQSGKIECSDGSATNLKYIYSRPLVITSGTIDTSDNYSWKKIFWNVNADSKALNLTWSQYDEFLVLNGDFEGNDELGTGIIHIDTSLFSHISFSPYDGFAVITGPDSWARIVTPNNALYASDDGGMYGVLRRKKLVSGNTCPTSARVPDITIPSEGG